MSLIKDSFKSFLWNFLGSMLAFVFQIVCAKLLGAKVFGEANYYIGFVLTITIFTGFGIQTYLPKNLHAVKDKKLVFSEAFTTLSLVFICISPIIFYILTNYVNLAMNIRIILLCYLTVIIEIVTFYYIGLSQNSFAMLHRRFLYNLLNILFFCILILIFKLQGHLGYIDSIIYTYICLIVPILFKNLKTLKLNFNILRSSFSFYLIQIVYGLYAAMSKVLQGQFGTFESVAVLSIAFSVGNVLGMLGTNFANVSMPQFAIAWKDKDIKTIEKVYQSVSRINCYLILPLALGIIINSNNLLNLLGKGYVGGEIILSLILFSQFFNNFVGPNGTLLTMVDKSKLEIINGIIKMAFSFIVLMLLGRKYIWGIAFSIAFSEFVVNLLKTIQVKRTLNILPYNIKTFRYVIVLLLVESILFYFASNITNIVLWIVSNIIIGVTIWFLTFKFSPIKNDREVLNNLLLKVKKRFVQ